MNERAELARAAAADEILHHPLLSEAMASFEKEIIESWASNETSVVDRERLKALLTAAQHFRKYLESTVQTGTLVKTKVERQTFGKMIRRALPMSD